MAEISPMMVRYKSIKDNNPDTMLFFRIGDFYEMFFDDAVEASKILEITLTRHSIGGGRHCPMCGVPFHAVDSYIAKLVENGKKVAICERIEDPKTAKGLVKRDIIRVVTKGSVIESEMLEEGVNNYLCSIYFGNDNCGIAFVDVSTGLLNVTTFEGKKAEKRIIKELSVYSPSEIVLNREATQNAELASFIKTRLGVPCEILDEEKFDFFFCKREFEKQFGKEKLDSLGVRDNEAIIVATGAVLSYLKHLYKTDIVNITDINVFSDSRFMSLDYSTKRNLELVETMHSHSKKGSLLWVLDRTKTAMGKRLLRNWILEPLNNYASITKRRNAVSELFSNSRLIDEISEILSGVFDIERLLTRICLNSANARDLNSLKRTISHLPDLKTALSGCKCSILSRIFSRIDTLEDVYSLIYSSIVEEPPLTLRDGGIIKEGFNSELDELNNIQKNGKKYLSQIEEEEREKTGIPKLKIGFNKVFGYYIEVTNSYKSLVPETYIRKQTLAGAERYITEDLKNVESKILGAGERSVKLERELFFRIRSKISDERTRIRLTAAAIARLDALVSLAKVAIENSYVCPIISLKPIISIKEGRHPVVEKVLTTTPFVPNDTYLDCDENRGAIITGPNMAGKSTYMRRVALICLMAQIGSFVPASSAELGIVDSIFTRVGASDDLATGRSTFMVEMNEVSNILKCATKNSLIILDEVGRGTSTFDGMSIARSCLEYITDKKKIGAKTLFSTHYHELSELEGQLDGVKNYNICVKKRGDTITFLRRIVRGKADGSYGIEVAKLAGIPNSVINRARVILSQLEENDFKKINSTPDFSRGNEQNSKPLSISLSSTIDDEIINELKNIDIDTMSPLESLTLLSKLVNKARLNGDF